MANRNGNRLSVQARSFRIRKIPKVSRRQSLCQKTILKKFPPIHNSPDRPTLLRIRIDLVRWVWQTLNPETRSSTSRNFPEADSYILKIRSVIPPIERGFTASEPWATSYPCPVEFASLINGKLWTGIADAPFILSPQNYNLSPINYEPNEP